MAVTISGMFGSGKTYFADAPVIIDIEGLQWSQNGATATSPFTIVRVEVIYKNKVVGDFREDTGGQTTAHFDISSALRAIWSDYDFGAPGAEVSKAKETLAVGTAQTVTREMREYSLRVYTEYMDSTDQAFMQTYAGEFPGGKCVMGGLTPGIHTPGCLKRRLERHTAIQRKQERTNDVSFPAFANNCSLEVYFI